MKRKYADRAGWPRVAERHFRLLYLQGDNKQQPPGIRPAAGIAGFTGYIGMITLDHVHQPLVKLVDGNTRILADDGYTWLQHLPIGGHHCLTTAFDRQGQVVEWYFDIVKEVGQETDGRVFFDDLYLDVIAAPDGEPELLDQDELKQALDDRSISPADFDLAWAEAHRILRGPLADREALLTFSLESLERMRRED